MNTDIKAKNLELYGNKLAQYVTPNSVGKLFRSLGGNEAVMNASYDRMADSGAAGDGTYVNCVFELVKLALKLNELYPEEMRADKASIVKVGLLCQISKVIMYEDNADNQWEVSKKGILYRYTELDGALHTGERSVFLCMQADIKFTEEEYEAMRSIDKGAEEEAFVKVRGRLLSYVIKMAYDMLTIIKKEEFRKKCKKQEKTT